MSAASEQAARQVRAIRELAYREAPMDDLSSPLHEIASRLVSVQGDLEDDAAREFSAINESEGLRRDLRDLEDQLDQVWSVLDRAVKLLEEHGGPRALAVAADARRLR